MGDLVDKRIIQKYARKYTNSLLDFFTHSHEAKRVISNNVCKSAFYLVEQIHNEKPHSNYLFYFGKPEFWANGRVITRTSCSILITEIIQQKKGLGAIIARILNSERNFYDSLAEPEKNPEPPKIEEDFPQGSTVYFLVSWFFGICAGFSQGA